MIFKCKDLKRRSNLAAAAAVGKSGGRIICFQFLVRNSTLRTTQNPHPLVFRFWFRVAAGGLGAEGPRVPRVPRGALGKAAAPGSDVTHPLRLSERQERGTPGPAPH